MEHNLSHQTTDGHIKVVIDGEGDWAADSIVLMLPRLQQPPGKHQYQALWATSRRRDLPTKFQLALSFC